jgi:hypothetical protein
MKILRLQVTLLVSRQTSKTDLPTTKRAPAAPLPKQLPLPFAEMSPPDSENLT